MQRTAATRQLAPERVPFTATLRSARRVFSALQPRSSRRAENDEPSGPAEARFLTAEDVLDGRPASGIGPAPEDPVRCPPVREGDILLPTVAREMQARVATDADAGAFPTAGLHHLRVTDRELVDP
ncbi:hypothetical protein [Streptomyces sp. NPDC058255]|uniref:hypothetical protein n=1 Tax=Streptomyces sp. NPDC058255 TaxID=3346407 RepID=UPI0036E313E1